LPVMAAKARWATRAYGCKFRKSKAGWNAPIAIANLYITQRQTRPKPTARMGAQGRHEYFWQDENGTSVKGAVCHLEKGVICI